MLEKPLTAFAMKKAQKARAHFMSRSNAAWHLLNTRAPHKFNLIRFRRMVALAIGQPCMFCGKPIKERDFSPDHRTPLSRGGKPTTANIVIIHLQCNHAKGSMTESEYLELLATIRDWDPKAHNDVLSRLRLGAAAKARWSMKWRRKQ